MNPFLSHLAKSLQQLLDRKMTPEEFRAKHRLDGLDPDDVILALMSQLDHYLDDDDIRAKDEGYRIMQETEMKALIAALRSNDLERAKRVTFLSRS